ncbi:MAG: CoA-binding protein [Saprospiraceae bacterium]
MSKKTLILGASENPSRMSFTALIQLKQHGHEVIAVGSREATINDTPIHTHIPNIKNLDTITLYIRPEIQNTMMDDIFKNKPKRIIFNPGTENKNLQAKANSLGIQTDNACTLVLLSLNQY